MASQNLFQYAKTDGTLVDVRSPAEYLQGHIPSSINIPLLNDSERILVGTCYKKQGQHAAVELGFDLVGHKMGAFIRSAKQLTSPLKIYCWRGGLRSRTMQWILQTAGIPCQIIPGGYKLFRRAALEELKKTRSIRILAGLTGSGKTETLLTMMNQGEQVLHLEALANHRGSAFGGIGMGLQPTCEHFENLIAVSLCDTSPELPLWIEDESRLIGTCKIPDALYEQMKEAPLTIIEKNKEERLQRILNEYGSASSETLIECVGHIKKKIGGQREAAIKSMILNRDVKSAFSLLIDYYDEKYSYTIEKRSSKALPMGSNGN